MNGGPAEPSGLVRAGALAAACGVSAQTISNYRQQGMPTAGLDRFGYVFRLAECKAWIAANKPPGINGGTRPGAGRKPAGHAAAKATATLLDPPTGGDEGVKVETLAASGVRLGELTTPQGLERALLLEADGGWTTAQTRRHREIFEAALQELEYRRELGAVLDAAQVKTAWGHALNGLRLRIEELPDRLLNAVMAAAKIDDERVARLVRDAMEAAVRRVLGDMAADPLAVELTDRRRGKRRSA